MTDYNANGYDGFRFMVDAKTSRQYALRYVNGVPQPPITVHAKDVAETKLKPNEILFAFDDEMSTEQRADGVYISTQAWQIIANKEGTLGKGTDVKFLPVEYRVAFVVDAEREGAVNIEYRLTADSKAALEDAGFIDDLPEKYVEELSLDDPGIDYSSGRPAIKQQLLSGLAFPPQHDGNAAIARFNVEANSQPAPKPAPVSQPAANTNTAPRPTPAFPRPTSTTTAPSPRTRTVERPRVPDSAIEAIIKQFCEDLSEKAANGKLDPVVGRDSETDQALKVMSRRKQASMCFTGDAGVGKTAMFSAVAQRLHDDRDNLPESLKDARVLVLDLQAMNAGAKFRGQFEEKLKPLIDGLKEREGYLKGRKVILAIDEIHSQLTAGKAEGGSDAGNMMKPFLTSQGISVMGTTTAEEYRKYIEKDGALSSRFEQLVVGEPKAEDTKYILNKLWPLYRDHHGLTEDLSDADLDYIVTMSNRYAPNESQPRKGEKVLSTAAASAEFRGSSKIEREDVISAIAQMSKLSIDFLNQNDMERFVKMETELPQKVLGQPGIQKVVDGLVGARSGLNDPNQPWGCFVLQGPTGTGKTELCKELARYLFGDEGAMIHLNMGEYAQEHSVARLIGAPPGYVGFDSAEPALTEKVRQRPYSIVLFDEIEKAHPKVFDVLLPVLNDGKMEDNQGKTVLFNNVIVVMTTNLGAKEAMALVKNGGSASMGFGAAADADKSPEAVQKRLEGTYKKARGDFFRPEMINRIEELGGFVTFLPLSQVVVSKLIDREISKVSDRLSKNDGAGLAGVSLEVGADVRAKLAKDGYVPEMGARPMRKVIREQIANPLGKWLMANKEELAAFVAKNGPTKLVIDKVGAEFAPQIEKAVSNNNTAEAAAKPVRKKVAAPKQG